MSSLPDPHRFSSTAATAMLALSGATLPAWLCLLGAGAALGQPRVEDAFVGALGAGGWSVAKGTLFAATLVPSAAMVATLPVTGRVSTNEKWACALLGVMGAPIYWLIFVRSFQQERTAEPT